MTAQRLIHAGMRHLLRLTPHDIRAPFMRTLGRSWPFFCPVCEEPVRRFLALPDFYRRQLTKYGSDLRTGDFETCNACGYECAHCGASDRDRLYALYLADRLPAVSHDQPFALLDIAPSAALSHHIRRKYGIRYRTADLFQTNVDDRVDITSMDCYDDRSFDAFICSHVLEHVDDDRKAMRELWRILRPGGWGIAMVPINSRLVDVREHAVNTEAERWKYFGQGDHVRVYTRHAFVERLEATGFRVLQLDQGYFGQDMMVRCGVDPSSVLYVVEKAIT